MSLVHLAVANSAAKHTDLPPDGRRALVAALASAEWRRYACARKKYERALLHLVGAPAHLFVEAQRRCCELRDRRDRLFLRVPGAEHMRRFHAATEEYAVFFGKRG